VSDPTLLAVESLLGVAAIAGTAAWAGIGRQDDPVSAELRFPADLTATQVEAVLGHIASLGVRATVCLTIDGTSAGVRFGLSAPYGAFHSLAAAASGIAPEVRVEESEPEPDTGFSRGVRLAWRGPWPRLRTDQPEHAVAGLLGSFSALRTDERLRLTITLRPAGRVRLPTSTSVTTTDVMGARLGRARRQPSPEELRAVRTKLAGPLLRASVLIAADATTPGRADHLIARVAAAIRSRQASRGAIAVRRLSATRLRRAVSAADAAPTPGFARPGVLLSPPELAAVIAWPVQAPRVLGLTYGTAPRLMPSSRIPSRGRGRVFGCSDWPGLTNRRLIQPPGGATTHSLVLGPTGVGKSTLVTGLALQQATAGEGLVFVDLKGDAADELLAGLPPARHDDVIVLDPSGGLPVPGLRAFGRGDPELAADLLLGTFRGLFEGTFGAYSEHYLRLGFLTLAADPAATLADVEPLFTNAAFRRRIVGSTADPRLRASWAAFEDLSVAQQAEQLASPLRKIAALVGRRVIRGVVAQAEPRFDLGQVLRQGQIVVATLSPGRLGSESTRLLAALLLWELYAAVLARQAMPPARRRPFGVYIDEPRVLTSIPVPLDSMFELFRGMNVGITMTGQAITQLPKAVQQAALTNAATLVAFRQHARPDAELLARHLPGVSAEQLQHVDQFAAVMRLGLSDGDIAPTVTGTTLPLPAPVADPAQLRQRSTERYGRSIAEVDAALLERHGLTPAPALTDSAQPADEPVGRRWRTS
jgi:hypothetical protein